MPLRRRLHSSGGVAAGNRPVQSPRQPTGCSGVGLKPGEPNPAADREPSDFACPKQTTLQHRTYSEITLASTSRASARNEPIGRKHGLCASRLECASNVMADWIEDSLSCSIHQLGSAANVKVAIERLNPCSL